MNVVSKLSTLSDGSASDSSVDPEFIKGSEFGIPESFRFPAVRQHSPLNRAADGCFRCRSRRCAAASSSRRPDAPPPPVVLPAGGGWSRTVRPRRGRSRARAVRRCRRPRARGRRRRVVRPRPPPRRPSLRRIPPAGHRSRRPSCRRRRRHRDHYGCGRTRFPRKRRRPEKREPVVESVFLRCFFSRKTATS